MGTRITYRQGVRISTYLTRDQFDAMMMHLAAMNEPVPPYEWMKSLICREAGVPWEPQKHGEKKLHDFLKRLQPFKDKLAGGRIAASLKRTAGPQEERIPASSQGRPEVLADSGMDSTPEAIPAAAADGADDDQGRTPRHPLNEQTSSPPPEPRGEPEQERAPAVRPHPSTIGMKSVFGRRRR